MSTYVLIHGSWHAAWCWYKIIPRLQSAGHKVIAPDMPAHGRDLRSPGPITMQDYVDTITKVLDEQDESVVLVAHSRAGLQATHTAEARPRKIHTLVYLAGILLPNGIRLTDWNDPDSVLWPNVDFNEQEGWDMIRPEIYRESIYHDCSDEDIALSYTLLTPEPRGPNSPTNTVIHTTLENFGSVPRVYIELSQDRAISQPFQQRMYTATRCDFLLSISASHSAYFSQPDELARNILIAGGDLGDQRRRTLDGGRNPVWPEHQAAEERLTGIHH
jgi:pimeloyl-ACP methyl ester carboxylesterase